MKTFICRTVCPTKENPKIGGQTILETQSMDKKIKKKKTQINMQSLVFVISCFQRYFIFSSFLFFGALCFIL